MSWNRDANNGLKYANTIENLLLVISVEIIIA